MPGLLDPALLLRASVGSDALYGEDDEIFVPGGGGWRLPDETEGSSGDDEAPLGAVFGWAELETPDAFSPGSECTEEDGCDGARPRRPLPCGIVALRRHPRFRAAPALLLRAARADAPNVPSRQRSRCFLSRAAVRRPPPPSHGAASRARWPALATSCCSPRRPPWRRASPRRTARRRK